MRISDWSSDVCSSDLRPGCGRGQVADAENAECRFAGCERRSEQCEDRAREDREHDEHGHRAGERQKALSPKQRPQLGEATGTVELAEVWRCNRSQGAQTKEVNARQPRRHM